LPRHALERLWVDLQQRGCFFSVQDPLKASNK
jgi:hypothetical protein